MCEIYRNYGIESIYRCSFYKEPSRTTQPSLPPEILRQTLIKTNLLKYWTTEILFKNHLSGIIQSFPRRFELN
jgi:hypothetical protein